jgi:hypothetical protein
MSKQEDIPKVRGSLGDDPMPTEDLVTQPLVVNGRIHGSAGEEDSPMVCQPFRYTLEQVNDLVMQSPWVASQDYKSTDMATPKLPGDGDLGREALLKEELTPPPGLSEGHLAQSTVHQGMGLEGPNGTAAQEQGNLLEVPKYFQDSPDQVNELVTQSPGSQGEVNRSVNQHNYNMQFGQVTAMGGSMPKRQRTSGGTYATMAR